MIGLCYGQTSHDQPLFSWTDPFSFPRIFFYIVKPRPKSPHPTHPSYFGPKLDLFNVKAPPPPPPFSMLYGTHQRSKNAKIGVLLGILRSSLIREKKGPF